MTNFGRIITAMVTPFGESGQVDYDVAAKLAKHLVENGSDSLVICGTTGESPTMTWDEEYQLFQSVKDAVGDRAKVIAGTGSNSTREAISATQKAADLGLDGALLVVPYYNKPPQDGLYLHFEAIAKAVPEMPIMLYNIPGRTGQNMLPETIAKLAKIDNIVSVKAASGSLDQASQIRRLTAPDFSIYSGDDSLTLPLLAAGATGVVSVASHIVGPQMKTMVDAFFAGKVSEASDMQQKLLPLFKALFATTNPIPVKAALRHLGWAVGGTRLPLPPIPDEIQEPLLQVMQELDLKPTA